MPIHKMRASLQILQFQEWSRSRTFGKAISMYLVIQPVCERQSKLDLVLVISNMTWDTPTFALSRRIGAFDVSAMIQAFVPAFEKSI